jgi:hypothetical protein
VNVKAETVKMKSKKKAAAKKLLKKRKDKAASIKQL